MTVDINVDPALGLTHAVLVELLDIWRGHCDGDAIPPWPMFDPLEIPPSTLPHLYLIDGLETMPPRLRWRLLGTHTTQMLGRDNTGKFFDELYPPDDVRDMSAPVLEIMEMRAPLRLSGRSLFVGKDWIHYECIYLPYSGDDGGISMIVGGIVYEPMGT
jgi:hypothetical protein